MKTLVKTFTAAALIAVSTFAMAANNPVSRPEKPEIDLSSADHAIDYYVAVTTEGESDGVEQLFTKDFTQKVQSSNAQTYRRDEVVKSLKKQKGEKLNCQVSTQVIEESADYMVAKVILKFEGFTKTDLVTLVHEGDSWKVSESINTYQ